MFKSTGTLKFSRTFSQCQIYEVRHYPNRDLLYRKLETSPWIWLIQNIYCLGKLSLNGIKVRVFFGKNIEKKLLCRHEKNYYYFWKPNIPVINLIVDSRNMIKVSTRWVRKKLDKQRESFSPNTNNFLAFFIVFEWGRILESEMDK